LTVNTPEIEKLILEVRRALVLNSRKTVGRYGVMISGGPASGKTTAAKAAMRYVWAQYTKDLPDWRTSNRIPIVYVESPPSATGKSLIGRLAYFLGLPTERHDTLESMLARVIKVLKTAGTRLVVVDELHTLNWHSPGNGESIDVLKSLSNRVPATFIYSGVNIHTGALVSGATGSQIKSRFVLQKMTSFTTANLAEWKVWNGLVRNFEGQLALPAHPSGTLSNETALLHTLTCGSINRLSWLLTSAAVDLVLRGVNPRDEFITAPQLQEISLDLGADLEMLTPERKSTRGPIKVA
jgi:hypothetical protein